MASSSESLKVPVASIQSTVASTFDAPHEGRGHRGVCSNRRGRFHVADVWGHCGATRSTKHRSYLDAQKRPDVDYAKASCPSNEARNQAACGKLRSIIASSPLHIAAPSPSRDRKAAETSCVYEGLRSRRLAIGIFQISNSIGILGRNWARNVLFLRS